MMNEINKSFISKSLFFLFFSIALSSIAFAAEPANGDFENTLGNYIFNTDLEYSTDMICTMDSGTVLDGTICTTPTTMCTGSNINVVGAAYADWELTHPDLTLNYFHCRDSSCPRPDDYPGDSTTFTNKVHWLEESVYDEYDPDLDGYAFFPTGTLPDRYYELGTFHRVRADYQDEIDDIWFRDRLADANVFCKGDLQVRVANADGGTAVGTYELSGDLPFGDLVTIAMDDPGEYRIDTRIVNAKCFAAATMIPMEESEGRFVINYYGYNAPVVPPATTTSPPIRVVEGRCEMAHGGSETSDSLEPGSVVGLALTVENTGDSPARATDVRSTTPGYNVREMNPRMCGTFGLPLYFCPESSGFGELVDPGESTELYLVVSRDGSSERCLDNVCIDYACPEGGCGGGGADSFCFDLCDASSCEIEPPREIVAEDSRGEFEVTCYDLGGSAVRCPGDGWSASGFSANFIERTNTRAVLSSDSPIGSRGTLDYSCGPGCSCSADVEVVDSRLDCEIIPPGADIEEGESQDFEVVCTYDDEEIDNDDFDDVDWELEDGLEGNLDDDGADGATLTATGDSEGSLTATVTYGDSTTSDSVPIRTGSYVDGILDDDSSTEYCQILPGSAQGPTNSKLMFLVLCGPPNERVACEPGSISWTSSPLGILDLETMPATDHLMKRLSIAGETGDQAGLTAQVGGDSEHTCTATVDVIETECYEYT